MELQVFCIAKVGHYIGKHYDSNYTDLTIIEAILKITEEFQDKFPTDYNWEEHRENGGEDIDAEIERFIDNNAPSYDLYPKE